MKYQNKFVKILLMSFILMLTFAACSPSGSGSDVEPSMEEGGATLDGPQWLLNELGSEDAPTAVIPNTSISLSFENGVISGSAGCNSYFGEVAQSGDSLSFGAIGSTKMACPGAIMQQENDYLAALGRVSSYTLANEQLILHYEDGRLIFSTGPEEETIKTIFVGPELVDCVGEAPQQCLQVKENEADEWSLFYDQIEGFVYEPGITYELRVKETEIENPPADASAIKLSLVEIVGQSTASATPEGQPEDNELLGTSWTLVSFATNDTQTAVLPETALTLNFDGQQINGSAGCNNYFADVAIKDGTLSIGLIGSTLMACLDEGIMQQESDFLAALAQATSYTLSGTSLTLHITDSDSALIFTKAAEAKMHEPKATAVGGAMGHMKSYA